MHRQDIKILIGLIIFYFFYFVYVHEVFSADQSAVSVATSRGGTTNYDEIKVGDVSCRQAMISATQLEVGVGTAGSADNNKIEDIADVNDAAVFARITYQLGMPKRIDCSRIYELELIRLREQLRQLQQ